MPDIFEHQERELLRLRIAVEQAEHERNSLRGALEESEEELVQADARIAAQQMLIDDLQARLLAAHHETGALLAVVNAARAILDEDSELKPWGLLEDALASLDAAQQGRG